LIAQLPLAAFASDRSADGPRSRHDVECADASSAFAAKSFGTRLAAWLEEGEPTPTPPAATDSTSSAKPATSTTTEPALHHPPPATIGPSGAPGKKPLTSRWWVWAEGAVVAGGVTYALVKKGGDDNVGGSHGDPTLPYFPGPPR
jgi:hypothetical protein